MKKLAVILQIIIILILWICKKEEMAQSKTSEVEFVYSKKTDSKKNRIDYSTIMSDSLKTKNAWFISYNDLKLYDTTSCTFNSAGSKHKIDYVMNVFGKMFVITLKR